MQIVFQGWHSETFFFFKYKAWHFIWISGWQTDCFKMQTHIIFEKKKKKKKIRMFAANVNWSKLWSPWG